MLLDDLSDTASGPSPRHRTVQVRVGDGACAVLVGGGAPIVVQSMTNTDTADIEGTVQQVAALARAGSELVRITVDRDEAAAAVPLVQQHGPQRYKACMQHLSSKCKHDASPL